MTSNPSDLGYDPQQVAAAVADRANRARPPAPQSLADAEAAVSARSPGATLIPDPAAVDEDGLPDPTGGFYTTSNLQDMLTGIGYDPHPVAAALAAHARADYPAFIYVQDLPQVIADLTTPPTDAEDQYADQAAAADAGHGDDQDLACPECLEPVRDQAPTAIGPNAGLVPEWSHTDGEPLCPVIGDTGYLPATPVPASVTAAAEESQVQAEARYREQAWAYALPDPTDEATGEFVWEGVVYSHDEWEITPERDGLTRRTTPPHTHHTDQSAQPDRAAQTEQAGHVRESDRPDAADLADDAAGDDWGW